MKHPLLYEINTRCWLAELSTRVGRPVTLRDVPESELAEWQRLGFTHIWLMGVWTSGPRSRAEALKNAYERQHYTEALPDWRESGVVASPYAISEYRVPNNLGGEEGLAAFRQRLNARGLKLLLDFVPNHMGLDHPWIRERPELLLQYPKDAPEAFSQATENGMRWLAHGKDPNMPAWTDTVQLDYRVGETRAEMAKLLSSVAARCDGVRCDMAMLVLGDVFAKTWERSPLPHAAKEAVVPAAQEDFWPGAIRQVKAAQPEFLFLAEVYWGLDGRLRELGFDYTYDKELYDRLVGHDGPGVQRHLLKLGVQSISGGAHFLENHDERRAASTLNPAEHRAAALLILGLPGMRFLHEGQLTGAKRRLPVQLARRCVEPVVEEIRNFYEQMLTALPQTAAGQGRAELLTPRAAWAENPTAENLVLVQWQGNTPEFDLVVVNLAPHRSQAYAPLDVAALKGNRWELRDLLGEERYERCGAELQERGLYLDLPAYGAQLFHFRPAGA